MASRATDFAAQQTPTGQRTGQLSAGRRTGQPSRQLHDSPTDSYVVDDTETASALDVPRRKCVEGENLRQRQGLALAAM